MDDGKKLLLAKANDLVNLCEQRNIPKFSCFLSSGEAAVIKADLKSKNAFFYGGYEFAERTVLGVLPDYLLDDIYSCFPVVLIECIYNNSFELSHRDVLGAIMSSGVNRNTIGDIIIQDGKVYIFALEEITDYLCTQITKIKNIGVTMKVIPISEEIVLGFCKKTEELRFTVASARIDATVSGLTNIGRNKSNEFITSGLVSVNSFTVTKTTKTVALNDVISVRGYGKYKIISVGEITKKGRTVIVAQKYK